MIFGLKNRIFEFKNHEINILDGRHLIENEVYKKNLLRFVS
jgi:hypothetical protein